MGAEFKSVADPCSGIIMHLEIQEGKLPMRRKEKYEELGAGAACTWRMTKHWHGTRRTVIGDSWFGSYKCARALKAVGLYSQFQVKTAHTEYPKKFLMNWAAEQDELRDEEGDRVPWGNWKVLKNTSNDNGTEDIYYALCHRDRKPKFLLSNKGTTLEGTPMRVERCRIGVDEDGRPFNDWYIKETPRPHMMQTYYDHFSCIDVHDHRRQGVFQMEKYWLTKCWWHRLFATVGIGMCMVDAFLAFRMDWQTNNEEDLDDMDDFLSFANKVAHSLIFNMYYDAPAARGPRREEPNAAVSLYVAI